MISYIPILKTTDAEVRAIKNLADEVKEKIAPLFELSKSRLSKYNKDGDVWRRLDHVSEAYNKKRIFLDITTEILLQNTQIKSFKTSINNYSEWCNFLIRVKKDYFSQVIPVLMLNYNESETEDEFYDRMGKQIKVLSNNFDYIAYRFPINEPLFLRDIEEIKGIIDLKKLYCIIDASFINQGKADANAEMSIKIINELKKMGINKFAVAATSFPLNPTEFGDEFNLEECELYKAVKAAAREVIYSDYGTLHHRRNSQSGGNGWIPRIDVPTENKLFYRRQGREKDEDEIREEYFDVYVRVAREIVEDDRYKVIKRMLKGKECWGIEQIELAAKGEPQGLNPSFWISVRANIHITVRTLLLKS